MILNNRHRLPEERLEIQPIKLENAHDFVALKGTHKLLIGKYNHEVAGGDLYIAFHNLCVYWSANEVLGGGELVPDRTMIFQGVKIYFEIDLGNMDEARLRSKIDRYRRYAGPGEKVIFVLRDGMYKIESTAVWILDYAKYQRLGNFVTVAVHGKIIKDPLGQVIGSPKDGLINLLDLCSQSYSPS
jgi:hypothetical protein